MCFKYGVYPCAARFGTWPFCLLPTFFFGPDLGCQPAKVPNPWVPGDGLAVVYFLFPRYRIGILVVLVRFADRGYLTCNVALECAFFFRAHRGYAVLHLLFDTPRRHSVAFQGGSGELRDGV